MELPCLPALVLLTLIVSAYAGTEVSKTVTKQAAPRTEAACVARGGEWIFAGPQNVVKYCFLQTTDGGKSCKASSQCQSECIEGASGNKCASTFTGCFEPTGHGTVTQCVN